MTSEGNVYQALVARRLQWDNLLWQVPVLAMTAQAFLYTITLSAGTSTLGRFIAASLSMVISYLSLTLMKSHRVAELTDSHILERMEIRAQKGKKHHADAIIHGPAIRHAREGQGSAGGAIDFFVPRTKGYRTWIGGLIIFGLGAPLAIVITIINPSVWNASP